MFVTALVCTHCGAEHPLDARLSCDTCLGPLEPAYDYAALRQHAHARAHRGRAADALALRRPAARRRAARPNGLPVGLSPLVNAPRLAEALGLRELHIKIEAANPTHSFKDRVVSVASAKAARARPRGARVRVDRQPRRRRRRPGRGARARGLHLHPGRSRAREDHRGLGARRAHLRRRGQLRRREPPVRRARLRAAVGVRQLQRAPVLRAGLEDARVRDRRAARLAPARPDDRADRLRLAATPRSIAASASCSRSASSRATSRCPTARRPRAARPVATAFRRNEEHVVPVRPDTIAKSLAIGSPADGANALKVARARPAAASRR